MKKGLENGQVITYSGERDESLEERLKKALEVKPEKAIIKKVKK